MLANNRLKMHLLAQRYLWLIPLTLYVFSAAPGAGWIDSPMIASNVQHLRCDTWVNTHNLFHILGKLWSWIFPIGELHYRLNVLCAIFGAACVQLMFNLCLLLSNSFRASLISSLALMLSHSLWWHSSMLEVYSLNAALIAALLYSFALYDKSRAPAYLFLTWFLLGLGITNHVMMGLFIFPLLLILLSPQAKPLRQPRILLLCLLSLLLGAQVYIFLFIRDLNIALLETRSQSLAQIWSSFSTVLDNATGAQFKNHMFPSELSLRSNINWKLNYIFLLLINFPNLLFFVGLSGFFRKCEFSLARTFTLLAIITQAVWSSNYLIWDMYAFGLPVWIMFSVFIALGLANLKIRNLYLVCSLNLVLAPVLYASVPYFAQSNGFWRNYFSGLNYISSMWDVPRYFALPWKRNYTAARDAADALYSVLPVESHLFDDDGKGYYPFALYYQTVQAERLDINYHQIFGPELTPLKALKHARQIEDLLKKGEDVFISSGSWPERPVLNQLYAILSGDYQNALRKAESLDLDKLEQTFPVYQLKQLKIFGDSKRYVYHIQERKLIPTAHIFEAEQMGLKTRKLSGKILVQHLDPRWSQAKHLLWLADNFGDEIELGFYFNADFDGKIFVRPTLSNDFVNISISFDNQLPLFYDGFAPSPTPAQELLIANGSFKAGMHTLRIRTLHPKTGQAPVSKSHELGFGLDYLRLE